MCVYVLFFEDPIPHRPDRSLTLNGVAHAPGWDTGVWRWAMQTCRCLPISTAAYRRTRTPWKPFHLRREAKQKRLCAYSFLNPIDRHSLTILMIIPFRLCAYTSSGRFLLIGVWASRLLYVFCSTSTSNSSPEDTAARESSPFCACAHVTQTNVSQRPPPLTDTCVSIGTDSDTA